MRVLTLTVAAFGPFKDEQTIDFSRLGDESIFLITGPTGAGKTTIFDAICYALYGKASGSDRDHNTLRSDFASPDQMTEVSLLFKLKQATYLIKRKPKQTRPKTRGEGMIEEPATASLFQIINNEEKLLSSKIKDVNDATTQLLGLDYDQFLKMIMIPQGEFRKLISENSNEREKILQKIFHTHIYQHITNELQDQSKDMVNQLNHLQRQMVDHFNHVEWDVDASERENWQTQDYLSQLTRLTKEIKQACQLEEKRYQKKKVTYTRAQEVYRKKEQLANDFNKLNQMKREKQQLDEQKETIKQLKLIYETAKKAADIEVYEDQVKTRKEEALAEEKKLGNIDHDLTRQLEGIEQKESEIKQLTEQKQVKDKQREKLVEQERQGESWARMLQIDKQIEQDQVEQNKLKRIGAEAVAEQAEIRTEIDKLNQTIGKELQLSEQLLTLKYQLKISKEQLNQASSLQSNFKRYIERGNAYATIVKSYDKTNQQLTEKNSKLQQLEHEERQHLASHFAESLVAGEPCPVCGSKTHPEPTNKIKDPTIEQDKETYLAAIARLDRELKELQEHVIDKKAAYKTQEQLLADLAVNFELKLEHLTAESIETLFTMNQTRVSQETTEVKKLANELEELKEKQARKQQLTDELLKLEHAQEQRNIEINQHEQEIATLTGEKNSHLKALPKTNLSFTDWQEEQETKKHQIENWLEIYAVKLDDFSGLKEQIMRLKSTFQAQKQFAKQLKDAFEDTKETFDEQLKTIGFTDESDYLLAKRSTEQRQEMKREIDNFQEHYNHLMKETLQLEEKLKDQEKPNLVEVQRELDQIQEIYENLIRVVEQLKEKQNQHEILLEQVTQLNETYKNMDHNFRDLSALANMASGDNHLKLSFERYVLSAFLEEILFQANLRLEKLTDHRYELKISEQLAKHGAKSGLDLEVFDQHTGKLRSVKTLSGGEGFKASLCLALGMADVVQAHAGGVQLDTLFIDEGFGTLDDVSLEQAVETLKSIQDSSRVLGIISHVSQLKEEIHVKLEITATSHGSIAQFNI